jgi:hypothetical protein
MPKNHSHSTRKRAERSLKEDDLKIILRGAVDLNGRGGVELLAALLKGEQTKTLRKLGLVDSPVFGIYEHIELWQVQERIQLAIGGGFLHLTERGGSPRLIITPNGQVLESEIHVKELLDRFDDLLDSGPPYELSELANLPNETLEQLLIIIQAKGESKYIPLLEAWEPFVTRRFRSRIAAVVNFLSGTG